MEEGVPHPRKGPSFDVPHGVLHRGKQETAILQNWAHLKRRLDCQHWAINGWVDFENNIQTNTKIQQNGIGGQLPAERSGGKPMSTELWMCILPYFSYQSQTLPSYVNAFKLSTVSNCNNSLNIILLYCMYFCIVSHRQCK